MEEAVRYQLYNRHRIFTSVCETDSRTIVVFCHGFAGTSSGPRRLFVRLARDLARIGIGSLRFDQYGSGNSDGEFIESSFNDWTETASAITEQFLAQNYRVALLGQSRGADAAIVVASQQSALAGLVAWVPQPGLNEPKSSSEEILELDGQFVRAQYYHEVHAAKVAQRLSNVHAPALIVQCADDEFIDEASRAAIQSGAQPHHAVVTYPGYRHSAWSVAQADEVCNRSLEFLAKVLG